MNYVSLPVVIIGSMLISAALLATLVKLTTPASSEPRAKRYAFTFDCSPSTNNRPSDQISQEMLEATMKGIRCPECGSKLKVINPTAIEQPNEEFGSIVRRRDCRNQACPAVDRGELVSLETRETVRVVRTRHRKPSRQTERRMVRRSQEG